MSQRTRINPTSLEASVAGALDELGIEYEAEYPTRTGFILDFALLDRKIAIEADGPTHDEPKRQKSDRFRDYQLRREGWKVIRLHHSLFDGDIVELVKERLQV